MTKTLEERLYAGDRAKEILENEVFIAAFDDIEKEVIETWTKTPARDDTGRERCYQYLMMLRKVKAHLTTTLETGKLAQMELQHRQTLADRMKAGLGF